MKNFYPEKKMVPFVQTKFELFKLVPFLNDFDFPIAIRRALYVMFRMESANGFKGVNNNYLGLQADAGRWNPKFDNLISGVTNKNENTTNKPRLFLTFASVKDCLTMGATILADRGLYVGGTPHKYHKFNIVTPSDWAVAYVREWVKGDPHFYPDAKTIASIKSIYLDAVEDITLEK